MSQLVTIKCQLDADLRRFSVPQVCTFEDLCEHIRGMYRLESNCFVIKYADDEGDLISVTTTEELVEAFRLSKELKPPILRITLYRTKEDPKKVEEVVVNESREYPPLPISEWDAPKKECTKKEEEVPKEPKKEEKEKEKESREYPPLPVAEWDAPQKKPVLLVSVKIPTQKEEVIIPISISAQIQSQCVATAADVSKHSQETIESVLPLAQSYPALAKNIASQCKDFSDATAEMSKHLSSLQKEEVLRMGETNKDAVELSLVTMRECQRLSEATAALCVSLSATTLEECKSLAAKSNALNVEATPHLAELSTDIKDKCGQLSSEVSASSVQTASAMRKLIMDL